MGCSKEMLQNGKRGGLVIMRLTEKDDLGHWFLKGLEWGQLREGKVITKAVAQKLYGALCSLRTMRIRAAT